MALQYKIEFKALNIDNSEASSFAIKSTQSYQSFSPTGSIKNHHKIRFGKKNFHSQ